ncbi:MAG: rhamnan synthesis F family protein [Chitinophagaceae bacterium]
MNTKPKIAVLYHLFYEDTFEKVCGELVPLLDLETTFLFNICIETPDKKVISGALRNKFPGCYIINTSNKGKDIGAKLALIQLFLELQIQADYLLFLHDKKSLQALKSNTWKKDLLKIVSPESIQKVIKIFQENSECGLIATKEYIIDEPLENGQFSGMNREILTTLVTDYRIKPKSYAFVAGTMFWARAKPVSDFFNQHNPLEIRKSLEDGNVLDNFSGTITHSWERILSWIVTSQSYSIKGIG